MTITIGHHTLRVEGGYNFYPGDYYTPPDQEYEVRRIYLCYGGREREIEYELSQIDLIEEYKKQH